MSGHNCKTPMVHKIDVAIIFSFVFLVVNTYLDLHTNECPWWERDWRIFTVVSSCIILAYSGELLCRRRRPRVRRWEWE